MRISLFSINIRTASTWLFLVAVLFAVSCKKNNYSVDLDEVKQAPTSAQFVLLDNKLRVDYFVRNVNAPYKIPVGFTNVANEDRTINLVYSSRNAASGVQFNGPASIVIPAGKVVDTLSFNGIFSGYPAGRKDTIKIKFSGVQGVDRRDSFELVLQRYCDVVLSSLAGEFANTNEYSATNVFQYGPYVTAVDNLVATGPTKAEGFFVNLYDEGWSDIKFVMDWSNAANFTITIPEQSTGSAGSAVKFVRSTPGRTNTFSSCDGTFSISIDRLNASKQLLGTSGYQIRLTR
jgi:hypothetical protein